MSPQKHKSRPARSSTRKFPPRSDAKNDPPKKDESVANNEHVATVEAYGESGAVDPDLPVSTDEQNSVLIHLCIRLSRHPSIHTYMHRQSLLHEFISTLCNSVTCHHKILTCFTVLHMYTLSCTPRNKRDDVAGLKAARELYWRCCVGMGM